MSSADEPGERRGLLPRFTLKDGDTFLLADALGDIQAADDGLFTNDTRMLSRFELFVAGPPALAARRGDQSRQHAVHRASHQPAARCAGRAGDPEGRDPHRAQSSAVAAAAGTSS